MTPSPVELTLPQQQPDGLSLPATNTASIKPMLMQNESLEVNIWQ